MTRACRAGDEQAWAVLVQRFSRYVYAIASQAYRLSAADAEEVFQEVFTRTFEHLDELRSDAALRPWIGQLTRRLAIDRLRQTSREHLGAETPEVIDAQAGPELDRIELALDVRAAMAVLPGECQEILDRFFARDESYREIAAALSIPTGTIASRMSRCLTKLRVQLSDSAG